jgi:hypothetical protein
MRKAAENRPQIVADERGFNMVGREFHEFVRIEGPKARQTIAQGNALGSETPNTPHPHHATPGPASSVSNGGEEAKRAFATMMEMGTIGVAKIEATRCG